VMQALVRCSHIAAGGTFRTTEIHEDVAKALGCSTADYKLGSLRYDLLKLRAKDLIQKLPRSHRYRLTPEGYKICLIYLKLAQKVYAPLTQGILDPFSPDDRIPPARATVLDQHYRAVVHALDELVTAVGLKAA